MQSSYALTNTVLRQVYLKMTLGMLVTAFVSLWASSSTAFLHFIGLHPATMWLLFLAEIGIVFFVTARITKMQSSTAALLFYVFSALNGLALSPIFIIYTMTSIVKTFFITAGTFGAMSIYGYFTTSDLSTWGKYLTYALFGLVIAIVVNLFLHSSQLEWIISIIGVLLFVGLTAWDTQQVKRMSEYATPDMAGRLSTLGALTLYLDFINLFLFLLRFFGASRD